MVYCRDLCDRTANCTSFHYDYMNQGQDTNCMVFTADATGAIASGNANDDEGICFVKGDVPVVAPDVEKEKEVDV